METLQENPDCQMAVGFKSYYVVWKHTFEVQDIFYGYGLNRTM